VRQVTVAGFQEVERLFGYTQLFFLGGGPDIVPQANHLAGPARGEYFEFTLLEYFICGGWPIEHIALVYRYLSLLCIVI
jgi:hypothetical protein